MNFVISGRPVSYVGSGRHPFRPQVRPELENGLVKTVHEGGTVGLRGITFDDGGEGLHVIDEVHNSPAAQGVRDGIPNGDGDYELSLCDVSAAVWGEEAIIALG